MQKALRQHFNRNFSEEKYKAYVKQLDNIHPGAIEFRNAETPVFVPKDFTNKMLNACEDIIDVITDDRFNSITQKAIPEEVKIPNDKGYSDFIAFDFGVCENENGELEPQLIEMQGFPTLFAYQVWDDEISRRHFDVPS